MLPGQISPIFQQPRFPWNNGISLILNHHLGGPIGRVRDPRWNLTRYYTLRLLTLWKPQTLLVTPRKGPPNRWQLDTPWHPIRILRVYHFVTTRSTSGSLLSTGHPLSRQEAESQFTRKVPQIPTPKGWVGGIGLSRSRKDTTEN